MLRLLFIPVFRFTLAMCMCMKMCLLSPFVKVFHDAEVVFLHSFEVVFMRQPFFGGAVSCIKTTSEERP